MALLFIFGLAIAGDPPSVPKKFAAEIKMGWSIPYAVNLQGNTLLYSVGDGTDKSTRKITPTKEQWRAFRHALDDQNVWRWRPRYRGSVTDGFSWSLHIEYFDRALIAEGYAAAPGQKDDAMLPRYAFTRYQLAVQKLIGDRPFPRRVKPIELFDLDELQLAATHPSRSERDQWAAFRDTSGKVHRVRRGEKVGSGGRLEKVTSDSVLVKEVVLDAENTWIQREEVMKKAAPR